MSSGWGGEISGAYEKFKIRCLNSYGMVFPEYIASLIKDLRAADMDASILICGDNGCLGSDVEIMVNGKAIRIKDAPKQFITKSYDMNKKIFVDVPAIKVSSGKKKLYRVKLQNGKSVLASEDHKWLTTKGWKRTIDLKVKTGIYNNSSSWKRN